MPSKKYNHRSASEIQKILSDQKASGQSQKSFCAEKQIPISTFTNWINKQRKTKQPNLPALIPVGSVPAATSSIEIELPRGEIIRFESGVNRSDLETVLQTLKRC